MSCNLREHSRASVDLAAHQVNVALPNGSGVSAAASRESARLRDGRFGVQRRDEAEGIDLGVGPDVGAPDPAAVRDQSEEDEALAFLRAVLIRADSTETSPASDSPRALVPVLNGAQMPPLTFSHPEPLDPARVTRIESASVIFPKPIGGLWATVGASADPSPTPWEQFLDYEDFRGGSSRCVRSAVTLRPDARVAYIDSLADFEALAAEHPNDPGWDDEFYAATGDRGSRPLDWDKVAERYDAVWVTKAAIADASRLGYDSPLNRWDMESVVITRREALA